MTPEEIAATIEALGPQDAAEKIAKEFDRLKPPPWKERLAEKRDDFRRWWWRNDFFVYSIVGLAALVWFVFWAVQDTGAKDRIEARSIQALLQTRTDNLDACIEGDKAGCAWTLENGSEEGKAIARKKLGVQ